LLWWPDCDVQEAVEWCGRRCLASEGAIANETDLLLIIGIDSEADHLPVGDVRKLWASDALQRKDEEIARAEAL